MDTFKKLSIKQVRKRLNCSLNNILDEVEAGHLPMYVYRVDWHADFPEQPDRDNINYLISTGAIVATLLEYKIEKSAIPKFRKQKDSKKLSFPAPDQSKRPNEYNDLTNQLKNSLKNHIDSLPDDYAMEQYEFIELRDSLEACSNLANKKKRPTESSHQGLPSKNHFPTRKEVKDNKEKITRLVKILKENGSCCYDIHTFLPKSQNEIDNNTACIMPIPYFQSNFVSMKDIYFHETDIINIEDKNGEKHPSNNVCKKNKPIKRVHGNSENNAQKREQVLGAALHILAKYPTNCKTANGNITATKIRKLIDQKAQLFWPDTHEAPLETATIDNLMRKYLNETIG